MDSSTDIEGPTNYAVNGRIMLCSVIILFSVVFLIMCFQSYARWFLHRHRRRISRRRPTDLFSHPVFPTTTHSVSPPQGLDFSVIKTLPTFTYSISTAAHEHDHPVLVDCAVCLSEFEDEEQCRVLPKCKHAFHVECIDAWFHSHSDCPLCRTPVQSYFPVHLPETSTQTVITVNEQPLVSEVEAELMGSSVPEILSPEWCRRKPMELVNVSVEVPTRKRSLEEMGLGSPEFENHRFKSPANRMVPLKRIWSI